MLRRTRTTGRRGVARDRRPRNRRLHQDSRVIASPASQPMRVRRADSRDGLRRHVATLGPSSSVRISAPASRRSGNRWRDVSGAAFIPLIYLRSCRTAVSPVGGTPWLIGSLRSCYRPAPAKHHTRPLPAARHPPGFPRSAMNMPNPRARPPPRPARTCTPRCQLGIIRCSA
jgi:hypothetical protein